MRLQIQLSSYFLIAVHVISFVFLMIIFYAYRAVQKWPLRYHFVESIYVKRGKGNKYCTYATINFILSSHIENTSETYIKHKLYNLKYSIEIVKKIFLYGHVLLVCRYSEERCTIFKGANCISTISRASACVAFLCKRLPGRTREF